MRELLWIVEAVAAGSGIGGHKIDGQTAATLAGKLRPGNCSPKTAKEVSTSTATRSYARCLPTWYCRSPDEERAG